MSRFRRVALLPLALLRVFTIGAGTGGLYRGMWDAKQTTGPGREFS